MTSKQRVCRKYPMAAWCSVSKCIYYGTCMSKSASSWAVAAKRIK